MRLFPSIKPAPDTGRLLRQSLLDAIESLRPEGDVAPGAHAWRGYRILTLRFAEGLDVPTTAHRLAISPGELFRDQRQALEAAASWLGERWGDADSGVMALRPSARSPAEAVREASFRRTPTRSRARLPAPLTSFVGREPELAEVKRLLGSTRLLTLTGAGGCGKTRLGLQVVTDLPADDVAFVNLAALGDPALVAPVIAATLEVGETPGEPILATLVRALQEKPLLLFLDNCEHLIAACASAVEALLQGCPSLRVLATSREALRIAGEVCWRVPSLAAPDPEQTGDNPARTLVRFDAVRLFVDRAQAARPGFQWTDANAVLVAQICWQLDGIPLALELAATRLRVMTVAEVVERLSDRFGLLTGGSRTALPRHQSLRTVIDWSYNPLSDVERAVFQCFAVFAADLT